MNSVFLKKTQAHAAESDAGIEATMHIDPADHPIAGKEANFFFTFQDPAGSFEIRRCDCVITLLKDEQEIDRQPAKSTDTAFSSLGSQPLYTKTFDAAGNYELHFSGNPINGATFLPFELDYDVSVVESGMSGTEHHAMAPSQHIGHILIFGGGLVAAIILLVRNYYQNRKQKNGAAASTDNINK